MNLHEYQAKELLESYGLKVQKGIVANTPDEAAKAFDTIGGKFAVVKAQVHAGGRGKGGGVKLAKSLEEVREISSQILGMQLVTPQTTSEGKKLE